MHHAHASSLGIVKVQIVRLRMCVYTIDQMSIGIWHGEQLPAIFVVGDKYMMPFTNVVIDVFIGSGYLHPRTGGGSNRMD